MKAPASSLPNTGTSFMPGERAKPQPQVDSFAAWRAAFSIGFVLAAYFAICMWSVPASMDGIQQPVVAEDSRLRELGVVLQEVTNPDRTAIVAADAILSDLAGKFVFVRSVKDTGLFIRHGVTAEQLQDGRIRILRGLHAGDQIVVRGGERLRAEPGIISDPADTKVNSGQRPQNGTITPKQ